jgi:hypothetical protein
MADDKKEVATDLSKDGDIFSRPMGVTDTSKANVKVYSPETGKEVVSPEIAGGIGADVGYATNKIAPTQQTTVKGIDQAQIQKQLADKLYQERLAQTEGLKTSHVENIDNIKTELDAAKARLSDAAAAYEDAKAKATSLNALPEKPLAPGELPSGDKWATKVTGSMGPGGESVTEAARNYRLQQNLTPSEASQFKASRSGLIVPNTVESTGPFLNEAQIAAQKEYEAAAVARQAAQQNAAKAQGMFESAGKRPAVPPQQQQRVAAAGEKAGQAAEKLKLLQAQSPSTLSKIGMALGKTPLMNIIGGAMSAAELAEMINNIDRGEYGKAAVNAAGGVGGAMMMFPHPATKVIGAGLSAIPLGIQAYQGLTSE